MKLYAVAEDNELDQFIGQDIWVKVHQRLHKGTGFEYVTPPSYIQILEKYFDDKKQCYCYAFHSIHHRFVTDPELDGFTLERDPRELNYIYHACCSEYELYKPVTILSTEDIFEILGVD